MSEVSPLFAAHRLTDSGLARCRQIADEFTELELTLMKLISPDNYRSTGREISLMKTKLEEAAFYCKKALAIQPQNQEPETR